MKEKIERAVIKPNETATLNRIQLYYYPTKESIENRRKQLKEKVVFILPNGKEV